MLKKKTKKLIFSKKKTKMAIFSKKNEKADFNFFLFFLIFFNFFLIAFYIQSFAAAEKDVYS